MKYKLVVAGGTFDRLHRGHKDFLSFTINLGEKVIIGLTSDSYINEFKGGLGILPYNERKKELQVYLDSVKKLDRVEIISIDDAYGPTLSNEYPINALAVTDDTEEMGAQINTQREEKGIPSLVLEVFQRKLSEDGKPITSTRIRNGEIDREGKLYVKKEWLDHDLVLPEALRDELAQPLGNVTQDIPDGLDSSEIITVGDITTKTFLEKGIRPFLAIIDFKVNREEHIWEVKELGTDRVVSPAGRISKELFIEILACVQNDNARKKIIIVEGEEDLAVLPVILAAPLGRKVYYGQPNVGMVHVIVSEEIKNKVRSLLEKFDNTQSV